MRKLVTAALACSALSLAAVPVAAEAQSRYRVCENVNVKKKANTGTLIGAVGGGLLGNAVASRGVKTEGTVLGAGVGAVVGHQVAKKSAQKECRWVYR